jgi:hypothetical protein
MPRAEVLQPRFGIGVSAGIAEGSVDPLTLLTALELPVGAVGDGVGCGTRDRGEVIAGFVAVGPATPPLVASHDHSDRNHKRGGPT